MVSYHRCVYIFVLFHLWIFLFFDLIIDQRSLDWVELCKINIQFLKMVWSLKLELVGNIWRNARYSWVLSSRYLNKVNFIIFIFIAAVYTIYIEVAASCDESAQIFSFELLTQVHNSYLLSFSNKLAEITLFLLNKTFYWWTSILWCFLFSIYLSFIL